jgi:hypothetical protein
LTGVAGVPRCVGARFAFGDFCKAAMRATPNRSGLHTTASGRPRRVNKNTMIELWLIRLLMGSRSLHSDSVLVVAFERTPAL